MQYEHKDIVNEIKNNKSGSCLLCAVSFAAYSFLASLSAMETNAAVAGYYGAEYAPMLYSLLLLSTAAGFLIYGITQSRVYDDRFLILISGILFTVSMILIYFFPVSVPVFIPALISPFMVGALGGCVYYRASCVFSGSRHPGLVIGGTYAFSVFVQFLVQNIVPHNFVRMIILIVLFCHTVEYANYGCVYQSEWRF